MSYQDILNQTNWVKTRDDAKQSNVNLVTLFENITILLQPDLILEFGAREAEFSKKMVNQLPKARIKCFEANPFSYQEYSKPFESIANVEYQNLAIGDTNQIVQIKIPGNDSNLTKGSASLAKRLNHPDQYNTQPVQQYTLDHLVNADPAKSIVAWIDVEGYLKPVIDGASSTLDRLNAIFVEVESRPFWHNQITDLQVYEEFTKYDLVPFAADRESPEQYNVIYVKSSILSQLKGI